MTQPSPATLRRLHRLAGALLDGNLTDKQQSELTAMLRVDDKARAYYIDFIAVHAQLHWRHDGQHQELPSVQDEKEVGSLLPERPE